MEIGTYWVDQIPKQPLLFTVYDENGDVMDLSPYTSADIKMLDNKNNEVDTSGGSVTIVDADSGAVRYTWPTTASLFDTAGDYIVQLKLSSASATDFTTPFTFTVRKLKEG